MKNNTNADEAMVEHLQGSSTEHVLQGAWKYFEIHSSQRMTLFNYFSAFSGLVVASIGSTFQADSKYAFVGAGLGVALSVVSFIFWKIDQRISFLVKHAEDIHVYLESGFPKPLQLFSSEPNKFGERSAGGQLKGMWTIGKSFRCLFLIMGFTGVLSAAASLFRVSGLF